MKEIAVYKEEVLARISKKQDDIRTRRRSRLSLVYPFAVAFAFLLLFPIPWITGVPRTVSRPDGSHYSYQTTNEYPKATDLSSYAEASLPEKPVSSLRDAEEAGFGGSDLTDSAKPTTSFYFVAFSDLSVITPNRTEAVGRVEPIRFGQTELVSRNGVSIARWQTRDGAYLLFSSGTEGRGFTPFFPLLCEVMTDGKPIARRLTEEALATIGKTEL